MFKTIGNIFNVIIARPIFNVLILILALIPGHDFGVAIIIFTILIRLALYPLLKKQLHHAMAMRKLQPELKRIKKEAAGDKQKESQMMMALYKEREINPFSSIGIILVQLPILIALYSGITKIVREPNQIIDFSYSWLHNLPYMQGLMENIGNFNPNFLGFIDLTRVPISNGVYWPGMILVVLSVAIQYFQSKQLMMTDKNAKGLKQVFKDTAKGKQVDQSEIQAATGRFTLLFMPLILFFVSISLPAALSLYWFVGGLVAYIQQTRILKKDVEELEAEVDNKKVTAEIINKNPTPKKSKTKRKSSKKRKKRRH
jgi:YidC/Oxa1 family membrane protein insertase